MGVYDWEMKFYNALYYISGVNSVKTDYDEYSNTLSVVVGGEFGASYNAPDEYEIRSKYNAIARDCPYRTTLRTEWDLGD